MESLEQELVERMKYRQKWASRDFFVSQLFGWVGVLSGGIAGAATLKGWLAGTVHGAIIAALPGFLLLIREKFAFDERATWNDEYAIDLASLMRKLRDRNAPVAKVSEELDALERRMGKTFPASTTKRMSTQR